MESERRCKGSADSRTAANVCVPAEVCRTLHRSLLDYNHEHWQHSLLGRMGNCPHTFFWHIAYPTTFAAIYCYYYYYYYYYYYKEYLKAIRAISHKRFKEGRKERKRVFYPPEPWSQILKKSTAGTLQQDLLRLCRFHCIATSQICCHKMHFMALKCAKIHLLLLLLLL